MICSPSRALKHMEETRSASEVLSMKQHESKRFQQILEHQQKETLRSINRVKQEGRGLQADSPQDLGDRSVINFSRELLFQQSTQKRQLLRNIETALQRIREGTFGECLCCGNEISLKRLEAMPFTAYCRDCQDSLERERSVEQERVEER